MSKPNPLPILVDRCGVKLGVLRRVLPQIYGHYATLHKLVRAPVLKPKIHKLLCDLTLTEWGRSSDPGTRQLLWDCYFPGYQPHIWHVLYYMLEIPMTQLVGKSGLTESAIRKYLPQPRVPQRHLRAIGRFAIEYRNAMSSKRSKGGVDLRYMILHSALTDPKRIRQHGKIYLE